LRKRALPFCRQFSGRKERKGEKGKDDARSFKNVKGGGGAKTPFAIPILSLGWEETGKRKGGGHIAVRERQGREEFPSYREAR